MAEALMFDTTFLIDFQRERSRRRHGPAHRLLEAWSESPMKTSVTVLGEFGEGFADWEDAVLQETISAFDVLDVDERTAYWYSRFVCSLRAQGRLIGANDLWIAAGAVRHELRLVTRNRSEFGRIPELQLVSY